MSNDVPSLLPSCQLKANNVWSKLMYGLYQKPWGRPLEHCHSAAVSAHHVRRNDDVARQPVGVDSVYGIGFL